MGIISTLISGGVLVGKICQALSNSLKTVCDEESGTMLEFAEEYECCGLKMMKINSEPYMLNTLSKPMDVTIPNIAAGNTLTYTIGGGEKQHIGELVKSDISPETEMLIGPVEEEGIKGSSDGIGNSVKMGFNKLSIGGDAVYVGGYGITMTEDEITIATNDVLPTLNYINIRNDKGSSMVSLEQISKEQGKEGSNLFKVPLRECGFAKGDVVSGSMYFSLDGYKRDFLMKNSRGCEPLTEGEKRCLAMLGVTLQK